MPGIDQHDVAQVGGGLGGVDRAAEAGFDQAGQVAAVIDVGVREDHRIDIRRLEAEAAVALVGLGARALVQPAVEQDGVPVDLEQVLGAGDSLGGAVEVDFHACLLK